MLKRVDSANGMRIIDDNTSATEGGDSHRRFARGITRAIRVRSR